MRIVSYTRIRWKKNFALKREIFWSCNPTFGETHATPLTSYHIKLKIHRPELVYRVRWNMGLRHWSPKWLNEYGINIQHCQESNSQPVPSQVGADPNRPQWWTALPCPLPRTTTVHIVKDLVYSSWTSNKSICLNLYHFITARTSPERHRVVGR